MLVVQIGKVGVSMHQAGMPMAVRVWFAGRGVNVMFVLVVFVVNVRVFVL